MQLDLDLKKEITDFGLYCGIGGMALGAARCLVRMGGYVGRFRCLGGIDVNPKACRNFGRLVGVPATCMDLFDREQYIDWHGKEPPADWREAMPEDILRAAGGKYPDLVELSAPCKGLSGLLSSEKSKSKKYQALNRLTVRGVFLTLEAFQKDLPSVIFFENVPRIQTRGADLISTMRSMLESYGYAVHCGVHNAGKLYGGGQNRIRFFMIARNIAKVPKLIYKPRDLPLRSIGDVLSQLPWPGDVERGGPMHRLPQISMTTALRLACIRPGHDWRDLQGDLSGIKLAHDARQGAYLVSRWSDPARTITGASGVGVSNSPQAVAQPLNGVPVDGDGKWTGQALRVTSEASPSPTVTSADGPSCGAVCVAQAIGRKEGLGANFGGAPGLMGVIPYNSSSPTVSASAGVTQSNMPAAVADIQIQSDRGRHTNHMAVNGWEDEAGTVTGATHVANGAPSVQDVRLGHEPRGGGPWGVNDWKEPAATVIGSSSVRGSNATAVADARPELKSIRLPDNDNRHSSKYRVQAHDEPSLTVTTSDRIGSGAPAVQDMRLPDLPGRHTTKYRVQDSKRPAATVTTDTDIQAGAPSVADLRVGPMGQGALHENVDGSTTRVKWDRPDDGIPSVDDLQVGSETDRRFNHVYDVSEWDHPSKTVASGTGPSCGGISVADLRLTCQPRGDSKGPLGVQAWNEPSSTVIASGDIWATAAALQDTREWHLPVIQTSYPYVFTEDAPGEWSWHRPLTTLDLAALQDMLPELVIAGGGVPLALEGNDRERREMIGNAVPVGAFQYIGTVILYSLMKGRLRDESVASDEVWVQDGDFLDFVNGYAEPAMQ